MVEHFIESGAGNRVQSAVLFSAQAYVTRRAELEVAAGLCRVQLEVLAHPLDRDSAQARVLGEGEILSVQYQALPVSESPQAELRELEQEERRLEEKRGVLDARKKSLARQYALLESVANFSKVQVPQEIQTRLPERDGLQQLLIYLDENGENLIERERGLNRELEALDRERDRVRRRLKQLRKPSQQTRKVIEVLFQSASAQRIAVEASYLAGRAGWQPVYKVDVPLDHGEAYLSRFAAINQNSGEDWPEVEVTLSDALPSRTGELPRAGTWRLREPFYASAKARMPAMAASADLDMEGLEEPLMEAMGEEESEAEYVQAAREDRGTSFEYRMPMPVNLESDERETLLPIERTQIEGRYYHYCVPRSDPLVYLVYATRPASDWPPGRINVHFGGRFVGKTRLDERSGGEETLFNLGPDRGVKVNLERASDKKTETFFGKVERQSVARELYDRIRTENLKAAPVELWLYHPIPVSETDRYQVKGVDLSPQPDEKDWLGREGVMLWRLTVAPGGSQTVDIRFSVRHPKDNIPEGL